MQKVLDEIFTLRDDNYVKVASSFFKTKEGEYSYGEEFLGIRIPTLRRLAKVHYRELSFDDLNCLISDKYHEIRLFALFVLVLKFKNQKDEVLDFYLKNIDFVNNLVFVYLSAPHILGSAVFPDDKIIFELANSKKLWQERISIVATQYFIKQGKFDTTLKLAQKFCSHRHDLIHKATGWMLREVGKKDKKLLCEFLNEHIRQLPRTTLRYAIERFEPLERKKYLSY